MRTSASIPFVLLCGCSFSPGHFGGEGIDAADAADSGNGGDDAANDASGDTTAAAKLCDPLQGGNKDSELAGAIDSLRIWTTVRTPTEICQAAGQSVCP